METISPNEIHQVLSYPGHRPNYSVQDKFIFTSSELRKEDQYSKYDLNTSKLGVLLSELGFIAEMNALEGKYFDEYDLWPLIFTQFEDGLTDWKIDVKGKLTQLSSRIMIWGSHLSFYCKYGGMDNDDHYCGLSLDIKRSNAKLMDATRSDRGDCMDEINRGDDATPASLTLFPNGGSYILTATTELLDIGNAPGLVCSKHIFAIIRDLKKCPVSEFANIFTQCGLSLEYNAIPAKLRTSIILSKPLIKLIKNDYVGARKALVDVLSDPTAGMSVKRKCEYEDAYLKNDMGASGEELSKVNTLLKLWKKNCVGKIDVLNALREHGMDVNAADRALTHKMDTDGYL